MSAATLLVLGLVCLTTGLIAAGLLWLDSLVDDWDAEKREAFWRWTHGRRP